MSFHWSEYLDLAQELTRESLASPLREAMFRTAISRAYYAAFGQARNRLVIIDGEEIPRGANTHQHVINTFEDSNDSRRRTIGHLLHHLRSTRNAADYESIFRRDLRGVTRGALGEAEEIIRMLETL